jgi:hypothetical protein
LASFTVLVVTLSPSEALLLATSFMYSSELWSIWAPPRS